MKNVFIFGTSVSLAGALVMTDLTGNIAKHGGAFLMAGIIPGLDIQLPWFVMLGLSLLVLVGWMLAYGGRHWRHTPIQVIAPASPTAEVLRKSPLPAIRRQVIIAARQS
ncbi:hypothetical protein JNJ66_01800 [Candidatus Saccharibacteria bacterium]|nr:hypothetical protein [Candidatus Saccharibacteria bacterium]